MARNKEFDDALDELKMLHDAKNHDYATAENPYKNLEKVLSIGIEPWRGIVIRLMDKFSRLEEYCVKGELAIKSEGIEDTFKDIANYSILAMILFRKEQKQAESYDVDRDGGLGISLTARLDQMKESDLYKSIAQKEAAKKARDEEIALQDLDNRGSIFDDMEKLEAQRQGHLRSKENVSHVQSIQRDANNN
jgi:hypothetical protein